MCTSCLLSSNTEFTVPGLADQKISERLLLPHTQTSSRSPTMELLTPSACDSRSAPPGNAPGTITVVVPSNNATAQEEKKTYPRKNEALGAMQVVIALVHVGLGILLLFSAKEFSPLAMNIYYPFWGGVLFLCSGSLASLAATKPIEGLAAASHMFNIFSGLGALAGTIILILDLIKMFLMNQPNISTSYLNAVEWLSKYIITLACEGVPNLAYYCKVIEAYQIGIMCMMLFFTLLEILAAFSTLTRSDEKKAKSHKDNEEQNVVLLPNPQPCPANAFTEQPPYISTE